MLWTHKVKEFKNSSVKQDFSVSGVLFPRTANATDVGLVPLFRNLSPHEYLGIATRSNTQL